MAISSTHYQLLKSIRHILPQGGSLLEIGEANWYGDANPLRMYDDINEEFTVRFDERHNVANLDEWPDAAKQLRAASESGSLFAVARAAYKILFDPSRIVSIDFDGSPEALRYDLNKTLPGYYPPIHGPMGLDDEGEEALGQFDLVYNHGTAEHIFNIAQVFRTMHDHCIDGGVMIHESPFTGWLDHGFYCLQPTLFYDLAAANCYEIVLVAIEHIESRTIIRLESREHVYDLGKRGEIPNNSMLYVVYRKRGDRPFKIPMQGYYARSLSAKGMQAWETLR